jgi:hypothetical protein
MQPHPDFAGRMPPRSAEIGPFRLVPLAPDAAEEDFAMVTGSARVLVGQFGGDWPKGLTLPENRIDLAWHEREFTLCRSFSWIIRDQNGAYLGCAYVFPEPGSVGKGKINLWVIDRPDRISLLSAVRQSLAAWLGPWLPQGGQYSWHLNDQPTPV